MFDLALCRCTFCRFIWDFVSDTAKNEPVVVKKYACQFTYNGVIMTFIYCLYQ